MTNMTIEAKMGVERWRYVADEDPSHTFGNTFYNVQVLLGFTSSVSVHIFSSVSGDGRNGSVKISKKRK